MSIDRLKTSTKLFILVRPSVVYSLKMIFAFIEGLYFAVLAEVKSINVRRGFNINKRILVTTRKEYEVHSPIRKKLYSKMVINAKPAEENYKMKL